MRRDMKKVWIVGSTGHVGSALVKLLDTTEYQLFVTDSGEVDVTDRESVTSYMKITKPDVIINCAGYTDVEECEKNPDKAFLVNALGARNLAMEADVWGSKLIQISTDDVFGGSEDVEHCEFDKTAPRSVYGKSKYAGEKYVSELTNRFVIIRSSWVYGIGKDFVNTVLATEKGGSFVAPVNQYSSPTSAVELAKVISWFIDHDMYGVYHVAGAGSCSRYEFAKTILEMSGRINDVELIPVEEKDGIRPCYSILDCMMMRLDQVGEMCDWKEALKDYLKSLGVYAG